MLVTPHPISSYLVLLVGCLLLLAGAVKLIRLGKSPSSSLRWMCVLDIACFFVGLGLGNADGNVGALLMLLYTGAARLLAWLSLDRLCAYAGSYDSGDLEGVGRSRPMTATLFAFSMFAAAGISPFMTPDAKPLVLHAALAAKAWPVAIMLVLANALIVVKTVLSVHGIWLKGGKYKEIREEVFFLSDNNLTKFILSSLGVILVLMGVFGHQLISFAAIFMGEATAALPALGADWHPAALVLFAAAFLLWPAGYSRLGKAKIGACAVAGLAFILILFFPIENALGQLFALLCTGMGFVVTVYSYAYIHKPHGGTGQSENNYFFFLLLLFGSLVGIAASRGLGSLFVFWELMTLSSYVLVSYENTRESHAAAVKYFIMCSVSAAFMLPGILLLSTSAGSLDLVELANSSASFTPALATGISLLALIGYGVKAGLVPGHSWLPDAHPAAPSSISAPLSGILTKFGIFGLTQLLFGVFGFGLFTSGAQNFEGFMPAIGAAVSFFGILTMVYGEWMALRQQDIKRLLAYSTMGQIGEITLTLGIFSYLAAAGALLHVINHAIMKDLLFLCSGALLLRAGGRNLSDLRGLGKAMPFTATCMIVGLIAIMGLPPFAGFTSKYLMLYAIAAYSPALAALLLTASLAGCVYYMRIIRTLVFEPYTGPPVEEAPALMRAVIALLAGLCLLLGLFPQLGLSLVEPVLASFVQAGKIVPLYLPTLDVNWPVYSAVLMLGALVPLWFRKNPKVAGKATAAVLAFSAFLVIYCGQDLDTLSFAFALLVPSFGAVNMYYSAGYMEHSHTQWRFYAFFLFMCGGLTGMAASTDLFNFFLFWEIMSSWSLYFVIVHEENPAALREGFKYFFFNVLGAAFLFLGVVLLAYWAGGSSFEHIRAAFTYLPNWQISFVCSLFAIGFVMKAAQLPFRIDIQMHPATAPTPVSGYISSMLLKSALFGLVKLFFMFGGGVALANSAVFIGKDTIMWLVLWIGSITIVMSATYAVFQKDLKLVLIYSTVSQLGYMVVGVAIGTSLGLAGGLLHLVNHMFFKDLLFLVAGAVIFTTHRQSMEQLGGLGAKMPWTMLFFSIGALCVIGVPPSNGFTSKWIIYHALMQEGYVLPAIMSLAGSLITLAYFAKFMHTVFLGSPAPGLEDVREAPKVMLAPMGLLAFGCVVTSIFPGLLLQPINLVLAELGMQTLDVAPWGIASGAGAWNATVASVLFAVAVFGSVYALRALTSNRRISTVHTCGINPADLNMHTTSVDIYSAPAAALVRTGAFVRRVVTFSIFRA